MEIGTRELKFRFGKIVCLVCSGLTALSGVGGEGATRGADCRGELVGPSGVRIPMLQETKEYAESSH